MSDLLLQGASILAASLRLGAPLVLGALGGLFAERAGIIDIAIEGKMLASAFAAAAVAWATGSPWYGLAAGIGAATVVALLHGYASIAQRGNQVVSGMALNILAAGLMPVLGAALFHQGGMTPALPPDARFGAIALPLSGAAVGLPFLDPLYTRIVSGHNLLVYAAAAAVPLAAWLLYRSRFGLRLRAAGENPQAVSTAGVSVPRLRYAALGITGVLCGLGGAYLSIAQGAGFTTNMTAGRGYLALAALIFGKWRPVPTALACLLFALSDAVQARLQGTPLPWIGVVPVQLVGAIPYILTVLLLAGFVGTARPPRALGQPYPRSQ